MTYNVVLAGVGGQGILSATAIRARAAMSADLGVKQSEVHGMSQRGGSVVAHLRFGAEPVHSPLVPRGGADLIIAGELLEAVRQLEYLSSHGTVIAANAEVRAMDEYPTTAELIAALEEAGNTHVIHADSLAKEAGSPRAATTVLIGTASSLLPISIDHLRRAIREQFDAKGERVIDANLLALDAGVENRG